MWTTKFCNAFNSVLNELEKDGDICINNLDTNKIDALIKSKSEREGLSVDEMQQLYNISDFLKRYEMGIYK